MCKVRPRWSFHQSKFFNVFLTFKILSQSIFSILTTSSNRQLSSGTLICIVATPLLTTSRQHHRYAPHQEFPSVLICLRSSEVTPTTNCHSWQQTCYSLITFLSPQPSHFSCLARTQTDLRSISGHFSSNGSYPRTLMYRYSLFNEQFILCPQ